MTRRKSNTSSSTTAHHRKSKSRIIRGLGLLIRRIHSVLQLTIEDFRKQKAKYTRFWMGTTSTTTRTSKKSTASTRLIPITSSLTSDAGIYTWMEVPLKEKPLRRKRKKRAMKPLGETIS